MTCDCCHEPSSAAYRYHYAFIEGATTVFCWRHFAFFSKCAGRIEELSLQRR